MNMKPEAQEDQRLPAVQVKSSKFGGIKKKAMNTENKTAQKPKTQQDQGFQVTDFESHRINGTEKKTKNIKRKKTQKQRRAQSRAARRREMQAKAPFYRESLQMESRASASRNHRKAAPFYMNDKDGEESPDISEEELTDTVGSKTDEGVRESEACENRKRELVGQPLSVTSSTKTRAVYAAVSLGTTLYFQVRYIDESR